MFPRFTLSPCLIVPGDPFQTVSMCSLSNWCKVTDWAELCTLSHSFLSLLHELWEEGKIIVQNCRGLSCQSDCLLTPGNTIATAGSPPSGQGRVAWKVVQDSLKRMVSYSRFVFLGWFNCVLETESVYLRRMIKRQMWNGWRWALFKKMCLHYLWKCLRPLMMYILKKSNLPKFTFAFVQL